jgi:CelD/BcsL family acetyltransferase involved in cellulose biosynthesis
VSDLTAELIDDAAGLAAVAGAWQELWQRVPTATPFQSPAWLLSWWYSFHPGALAVVAVRWGERLVGLAPLYIEHGPTYDRVLPLGIGVSDYLDLLIDPESAVSLDSFLDPLRRFLPGWRSCDLEELPPWSSALALPLSADGSRTLEIQSACPVLDLARPISIGMQRRLRRGARRAERRGGFHIRSVGNAEIDGFLSALFRLHGVRWQTRAAQPGVLQDAAVRAFHRCAVPALSRAGIVRLYELRVGGEVAGCYYGLLDRGRAYAYIGGFDPRFAAISPGGLLLAHAIDEARREGCREFHFLRGQEAYKYEWGAVDRWNRRLRLEGALNPHAA